MLIDEPPTPDDAVERAADLAIELRKAVDDLPDPALRDLADLILIELGRQIAQRPAHGT